MCSSEKQTGCRCRRGDKLQYRDALVTLNNLCHDQVNRAAAEAVEKGRWDEIDGGDYSDQNTIGAQHVGVSQDNGISMDPPPRAKTKGRCKTATEKKEVTLGAQGEKKGTRRCSVCHLLSTHNSATCPTKQENKERLEAKKNKKRGRPAGAKNKRNKSVQGNDRDMQEERPTTRRRMLLEDNCHTEINSNSEDDDEYVDDENVDEADLL